MSSFMLCDGADCSKTENDGVFNVDRDLSDYLKKHHKYQIDSEVQDLCEDCKNSINEGYEKDMPLIVIDEYDDFVLNENFMKVE